MRESAQSCRLSGIYIGKSRNILHRVGIQLADVGRHAVDQHIGRAILIVKQIDRELLLARLHPHARCSGILAHTYLGTDDLELAESLQGIINRGVVSQLLAQRVESVDERRIGVGGFAFGGDHYRVNVDDTHATLGVVSLFRPHQHLLRYGGFVGLKMRPWERDVGRREGLGVDAQGDRAGTSPAVEGLDVVIGRVGHVDARNLKMIASREREYTEHLSPLLEDGNTRMLGLAQQPRDFALNVLRLFDLVHYFRVVALENLAHIVTSPTIGEHDQIEKFSSPNPLSEEIGSRSLDRTMQIGAEQEIAEDRFALRIHGHRLSIRDRHGKATRCRNSSTVANAEL